MKNRIGTLAAALVLAIQGVVGAAKTPSNFSDFAGNYSGSLIVILGGMAASGTTQGHISASKKKPSAKIDLTSVVSDGTTTSPWVEDYGIRKKSLDYLLRIGTTVASGSGRAKSHKNTISISGTFTINGGGATYTFTGRLRKNKNSLRIIETFTSATATPITVSYDLRRSG